MKYQFLAVLAQGIPLDPLPEYPPIDKSVPHAPKRALPLSSSQLRQAVKNSLRYFPEQLHKELGEEFLNELKQYGHIYMYRFRPNFPVKAYPAEFYPAKLPQAKAIIHNILNNLDPEVAQFPHQLITYGGNGSVFQNWGQFWLVMKLLCEMEQGQTLVLNSGHPQGLYPAPIHSPKITICNGLMIPNYSSIQMYNKLYAMGCTMYGQMTAGSFCYIGSQGIVHGTTLTLLNAARKYKGREQMKGLLYVTSGLGGMSGAQPKAGQICGCVTIVAEVVQSALDKRLKQGWLRQKFTDLTLLIKRAKQAKQKGETTSLGYLGNVVDLWQKLAQQQQNIVELGSDQTSCHNPFGGGYYPAGLSVQESNKMMIEAPLEFKAQVEQSLRRQIRAINKLTAKGMSFWDYGNSFLLQSSKAKAEVLDGQGRFKYPSYVQDIMGDIFQLGFGPFRWMCTSTLQEDLKLTDEVALQVLKEIYQKQPEYIRKQLRDNIRWIEQAQQSKLVVGSQARILYADHLGRTKLAQAFSDLVRDGKVKGPIILSRDHHDVSGVDSPFRETSSVKDGSMFTADMSTQNYVGTAVRGATWVALHNGGGCGWGNVNNGGFGMVLVGAEGEKQRVSQLLFFDVANGVSRRAWAGGESASRNLQRLHEWSDKVKITQGIVCKSETLDELMRF